MKWNPIIGNAKNKLGNMVLYTRGGVQYGRVYVPQPRNPRTHLQIMSRAKLRFMSQIASGYGCIARLGFSPVVTGRYTAQNAFVKENMPLVLGEGPQDLTITYSDVVVAKGAVTAVSFGSPNFSNPNKVVVPIISTNSDVCNAEEDDEIIVGLYSADLKQAVVTPAGTYKRGDSLESIEIDTPTRWQGEKVYVYGFVRRIKDGNISTSNTSYIGMGTIS